MTTRYAIRLITTLGAFWLQKLQVIERAVRLWTNPGDVVLTPFLGIGSEAYVALKLGRRAVGIELKESYFRAAVRNLEVAVAERGQATLFDVEES